MRQARTYKELVRWLKSIPRRPSNRAKKVREFWIKFLSQEPTSEREWRQAETYAGSWQMCACGTALPRELRVGGYMTNGPDDSTLDHLGMEFSRYVRDRDYEYARQTFLEIQNREAVLLNEEGVKDPSFT